MNSLSWNMPTTRRQSLVARAGPLAARAFSSASTRLANVSSVNSCMTPSLQRIRTNPFYYWRECGAVATLTAGSVKKMGTGRHWFAIPRLPASHAGVPGQLRRQRPRQVAGVDQLGQKRRQAEPFPAGLVGVGEGVPQADHLVTADQRAAAAVPLGQQARQLAEVGAGLGQQRSQRLVQPPGGGGGGHDGVL